MGTHCSSELYRGHILKSKINMMKLFLLTALAAVAFAEPEAEAGYYSYNPGFYNYYGHQLNWPGIRAPGFSSTCFGCRGKRSAEAEAAPVYYGYGYYGYPYGFGYRTFGTGIAAHPGYATSFTYRSPQGLRGKRSADAEPEAEADAEAGYYGYPYYGYGNYGYGYGLPGRSFAHFGGHPLGKRSAEAEAEPAYYGLGYGYGLYRPYFGYRAYGPGVARHPSGTSFTYRSVQGFGK